MKCPFTEDTLGQKLETRTGLSVHCLTCKRSAMLDVAELVRRLGPDHSCMPYALVKVFYCRECRAAGREDRDLQFTNHAVSEEKQYWVRETRIASG
jgi:hypothetical protein